MEKDESYYLKKINGYGNFLASVNESEEALEFVPEELKPNTMEKFISDISQKGDSFRLFHENLKTKEICIEAVNQNGYSLRFVPEKLKTKEICATALSQDRSALEFVPES